MVDEHLDQMLNLAAEIVSLADVEKTLDKREWKKAKQRHDNLQAKFYEVRNQYVDVLLSGLSTPPDAYDLVCGNIEYIKETCDPSWLPALDYVADGLLPYLKKETDLDPRVRTIIKAAPWILFGAGLLVYFGIRFFSAIPISHAIETREGIQERAAAVIKLLRYDDWMHTRVRRGGWVKGILLWPIEPNDEEIKAAGDFAGLAFEAQKISAERFGCLPILRSSGQALSDPEIKYIRQAAEYFSGSSIKWNATPVLTVLDQARIIGHCDEDNPIYP